MEKKNPIHYHWRQTKLISKWLLKFLLIFFVAILYGNFTAVAYTEQKSSLVNLPFLAQDSHKFRETLLDVYINDVDSHEVVCFLLDHSQHLYVSQEKIQNWRFKLPKHHAMNYKGRQYYKLNWISELHYRIEQGSMNLYIYVPSKTFHSTTIQDFHFQSHDGAQLPSPGGFINYDFSLQHEDNTYENKQGNNTALNSLSEFGFFNRYGVGTTSILTHGSDKNHLIRLDTTWTTDQPESMSSFKIGDSITRAASWSGSVRFAGIQFARNFNTQPGFITYPLPSVKGESTIPTLANLIINNVSTEKKQIGPGPFSIEGLPVTTGAGNISVVTRDLLGRQHTITTSYYASEELLKPGLDDYSYSLGFARENYGVDSNKYGRFLALGTYRLGFTPTMTGGLHGEFLAKQQDLGISTHYLFNTFGIFHHSIAISHSHLGIGAALGFGFERKAASLSFTMTAKFSNKNFTHIGLQPGERAPSFEGSVFLGYSKSRIGSFGLGYIDQNNRDTRHENILIANYSKGIHKDLSLGISVLTDTTNHKNSQAYLYFIWNLGERDSFTFHSTFQQNNNHVGIRLNKYLPTGPGYGYHLAATHDGNNSYDMGFDYQNKIGTYNIQTTKYKGQTSYQANAAGSMAILGGETYLSRNLDGNSFAVVQVPNVPRVKVYGNGHFIGRTDARGNALIPGLIPYIKNQIHIDPEDIPLNTNLKTDRLAAYPYYRTGVLIQFPIKKNRAGILHVFDSSGKNIPSGAKISIVGQPHVLSFIGNDGEAYLSNFLPKKNKLIVSWNDQSCEFSLIYPKTQDPLPDLGKFTCKEEKYVNKSI